MQDKVVHQAVVVEQHASPIGVERLAGAKALVTAAAAADHVHAAEAALGLGMRLDISSYLRGACQQKQSKTTPENLCVKPALSRTSKIYIIEAKFKK